MREIQSTVIKPLIFVPPAEGVVESKKFIILEL